MPATSKSFNKEKSARFADPDEEIPSLEVAAKEEVSKEEVSKEKTPPVNYFSLYRTASRLDWVCIIIGTLGALGNGAAWPIFAIIFGEFTDTFGDAARSSSFMDDVSNIALYFLYLGIGSAVCAYLQASLWIWAGNQQANRLRQLYLRAVLKQDIPFFDTQATTGQLLQTLNDDSQQVQAAISEKAAHFLQHTSTFIVGWVVAFVKGWDMTLVMIGCLPFLAAVGASLAKMSSTTQAKAQEAYQKASSIAQQAISQARTVVAYGQEEKSIQDYDAQLEEPAKAGVRQAFFTGISLGGINTVVYCTYAVAFIYGAWRVKTGDYTGGQVLQVLVAALLGGFSLGQATPVLETFTRGCSAGGRLFAVIERKPAISLDEEGGEAPESVRGEIELRDVHFCYPARPDVAVFTEFNLLIPAGKTVALVGESGSGKSTVVSLIERFYDPAAGAVLLDGVDLRRYNLRWLRSQVGLVSQEPTLFATNIYDNIAMGREGASQEEIEAAARAANAHEFISNLPLKYQTQVGERGLQLSGGQKQRIAIARAILKNPKILLLDEATSALDTQSERLVQEALDRMVVGRTTVVVAHRLSTVQDADIIAAVKQGRVVEQGSHEELIQNPVGMYTALVKIQMQKAEEEEERKKKEAEVEEDDEVDTSDEVVEGGAENTLEGHHSGANGIEQATKVAALPEATTTDHVALAVTQPVGTRAAAAAAGPNSKEWWPIKRVSGEKRVSQERRRSHQLEGGPASDRALQAGADQHGPASNTQLPGAQGDYDHDAKDKDRDAKEEKPVDVPLSRLIAYNKPEWKYAVVGVVASAAAGCINPSFALIISSFISVFYETSKSEMLQKAGFWSGMFVVIGAGSLLSTTLQQFCFGVMGQRLARRLRVMLFRAIMHQEIGWFDLEANSSGILTTRLSADASHVRGAVGDTLSLILQNIACLAFGYIVAFVFMWRMALLITGALPFMIAGALIYYKMVTGFESGADKLYGQANQAVSDAFSSVRVVQAYNLQEPVSRLYEARLGEANKTMLRRSQITGVLMAYSQFATFAVYGLIIWFGGYEVDKGHSSFEDMLKAFLALLISALGIAQSQIGFPDAGKAKGAIQAIFPIIDRKPLIDASDPAGLQPDKVQGEIELVNIKFVYPSRKTVVVFRHFNLAIPAGKTVALVGESGSGKSTVVGLIERFYDPAEGSVLLDGIDLRQYNLRWLRSQIALVSQEPLLFSCSVLDNIRYGRPDASMEDVIEAAKAANIHSLIDKMPEKYDTQVGERGIQLSGGQKQRVAIARAVLKNPRILLLDEATSALDSQSERLVQDALDRIMVGRTSVVVAHRLSTIRNAHLIALVFRGRVLEKGTHEELMAIPNGGYAALVAAQMGSKSSRSQSLNAAAAAAAAAALPTVTP